MVKERDYLNVYNSDELELIIEEQEKEVLLKLGWLFKNSLDEFSTYIDNSLKYLDKIILPTVMASKHDKSYNPFAEIIEKYVIYILTRKLEKEGYKFLPLGYSADLTFEGEAHILNIDVKTANLDNTSDYKETINVGINQFTHVAKLPIGSNKDDYLPDPFFVYPTLPPYYQLPDSKRKFVLTYGLLFIYPSYSDLLKDIREDYQNLYNFFKQKIENILVPKLKELLKIDEKEVKELLQKKPQKSSHTREELITENIIRGIFIHEYESEKIKKELNINKEEEEYITEFKEKLQNLINKLREKDIKPIAIIAIAIPNGLLKQYTNEFVSGKDYSKSARYHYQDGIFKVIKEKKHEDFPRVLLLSYNENYKDKLKKHFKNIKVLNYKIDSL